MGNHTLCEASIVAFELTIQQKYFPAWYSSPKKGGFFLIFRSHGVTQQVGQETWVRKLPPTGTRTHLLSTALARISQIWGGHEF